MDAELSVLPDYLTVLMYLLQLEGVNYTDWESDSHYNSSCGELYVVIGPRRIAHWHRHFIYFLFSKKIPIISKSILSENKEVEIKISIVSPSAIRLISKIYRPKRWHVQNDKPPYFIRSYITRFTSFTIEMGFIPH